jgi:C4-dicarboxylate-specific signal transduction histidine kinase
MGRLFHLTDKASDKMVRLISDCAADEHFFWGFQDAKKDCHDAALSTFIQLSPRYCPETSMTFRRGCIVLYLLLYGAVLWASPETDLILKRRQAREARDIDLECSALIELGEYYLQANKLDEALSNLLIAYQLANDRNYNPDVVYVAVALGNVYDMKSDLKTALDYYSIALSLADKGLARKYRSHIHNNMGNLYMKIGSFTQSLDHYQQALQIKREQNDPAEIANALTNLSIYYLRTGNYDRCLDYQMQALAIREELKDEAGIAAIMSSISVTYRHMEDYPQAFKYNRQALELYQKSENQAKIASAYNNLGVLYLATKDLRKAKESYLKSYAMKKDSQDLHSILASLVNLADISLKLGQMTDAEKYLKAAAEIESRTQYYELSRILYKLHSDYHAAKGNYQDALRYFNAYHSISDSLRSIENSRQLNELEIKYAVMEKERNIELLTRNNELAGQELKNTAKLRNYLYLIIALILITTLLIIWRYRSVIRVSRELRTSKEKLNILNTELEQRVSDEVEKRRNQEQKALRQSRLALLGELAAGISHELNQPMQTLSLTLENIKEALIDKNIDEDYLERKLNYLFGDIERMQKVIDHIRRFSRPGSEDQEEYFDPLTSIANAVELVKERFEKSLLKISTHLTNAPCLIKGSSNKFEHVLLNLLTNSRDAILANLETGKINAGSINISAEVLNQQMLIRVADNGCGIAPELQDKVFDLFFSTKNPDMGTGLGLAISQSTLKAMQAELTFESVPDTGTTFTISIPIQINPQE